MRRRSGFTVGVWLALGALMPGHAKDSPTVRELQLKVLEQKVVVQRAQNELAKLEDQLAAAQRGAGNKRPAMKRPRPKPKPRRSRYDVDEPFVGEVRIFGGNFAPRGWAFCDGQLLSVSENTALFSLLGTTYGGDGRTTFGLPDLRGRTASHAGKGPGLMDLPQGQIRGATSMKPGTGPARSLAWLGVRYIIALQGIYPSRS